MAGGSSSANAGKKLPTKPVQTLEIDTDASVMTEGRHKLLCLDFERNAGSVVTGSGGDGPSTSSTSQHAQSQALQFSSEQFAKLLGTMNGLADRLDAVEAKKATKRHQVHQLSDSEDDASSADYEDSESEQMDDDPAENDDIMGKLGKSLTF